MGYWNERSIDTRTWGDVQDEMDQDRRDGYVLPTPRPLYTTVPSSEKQTTKTATSAN